jgi:hypothetical protein
MYYIAFKNRLIMTDVITMRDPGFGHTLTTGTGRMIKFDTFQDLFNSFITKEQATTQFPEYFI